jgi:DMSO reductase family type II enzyme heme b subunit
MYCILNKKQGRGWNLCVIVSLWLWIAACGSGGENFSDCLDKGDCIDSLDVVQYSGNIPRAPDAPFWSSSRGPKKQVVDLGPQLITNPQWPNPSVKQVILSAARTDSEIAIRVEWEDDSDDRGLSSTRLYTDQAAVMFPLHRTREVPPITMGGQGEAVNIWQWKAVRQEEFNQLMAAAPDQGKAVKIPSPVEDLNAEGFSTLTHQDQQDVEGFGKRTGKGWQVVFKRSLTNADEHDAQLSGSTPMAVAVWNGGNRETNGQKGLVGWILLRFVQAGESGV